MMENLRVTRFRNGERLNHVINNPDWQLSSENAYCHFDNKLNNVKLEGILYNWYAVTDARGLAPEGWHIPSDNDWFDLYDYLGGIENAGYKMKQQSVDFWGEKAPVATNESGFSALPTGYRSRDGKYYRDSVYYWSSSYGYDEEYGDLISFVELDRWSPDTIHFHAYPEWNTSGFSVRCIKD